MALREYAARGGGVTTDGLIDQVYITSLLDEFKNHSFLLYRVANNFCSNASFRDSVFSLGPILEQGTQAAMDFEHLFAVEGKLGSNNEIMKVQTFLKGCNQIPWHNVPSKKNNMYETTEVMVDLAKKVLLPLFERVEFEPKYKEMVKNIPGLEVSNIGLGSIYTLHGMPDLRLPGLYIIATTDTMSVEGGEEEVEEEEEVEKEGEEPSLSSGYSRVTKTYVEGKRSMSFKDDINQFVATCTTSSFTNYNNNGTLNPLTPTILMNHNAFHVGLYDCVHDILHISQPCQLFDTSKHGRRTLSPNACLFLWIVVNHRFVFGSWVSDSTIEQSTI